MSSSPTQVAEVMLCLSSGANPQYRLDVLRLLALPSGMDIQFRYGVELVGNDLRAPLAADQLVGKRVLLAHVQTGTGIGGCVPGQFCPVTPCRYANVQQSTQVGDFYTLRFRLSDFAPASTAAEFQSQLPIERPQLDANGSLGGKWCLSTSGIEKSCPPSKEPEAWQEIITALWHKADFRDQPFYFTVTDMYARDAQKPEQPEDGQYRLRSGKNYEISIMHWHPRGDDYQMPPEAGTITLNFGSTQLEAVTTPKRPVDSPYDLNPFYFRANDTLSKQATAIVIGVEGRSDGKAIESQPELYIPVQIRPNWAKAIRALLMIGIALWLEQCYASADKVGISIEKALGLLGLSLVTAATVVFGWKKL